MDEVYGAPHGYRYGQCRNGVETKPKGHRRDYEEDVQKSFHRSSFIDEIKPVRRGLNFMPRSTSLLMA